MKQIKACFYTRRNYSGSVWPGGLPDRRLTDGWDNFQRDEIREHRDGGNRCDQRGESLRYVDFGGVCPG